MSTKPDYDPEADYWYYSTWRMATILEEGSAEERSLAFNDLLTMATLLDEYVAHAKRHGWRLPFYTLRNSNGHNFAPAPGKEPWTYPQNRPAQCFVTLEDAERTRDDWNTYWSTKGYDRRCKVEMHP
ncbi:MAG: hypothetical protein LC676_07935 [Loktanella sp.]|nr:hypothetical protein [Loktanella sp.]